MYGEIAVEMLSEKEKEDWTVREFKLSMVSSARTHTHTHTHTHNTTPSYEQNIIV